MEKACTQCARVQKEQASDSEVYDNRGDILRRSELDNTPLELGSHLDGTYCDVAAVRAEEMMHLLL